MKFLVPIYSCLQNRWIGGYVPISPFSLSSVLNWICWTPPEKRFPRYATDVRQYDSWLRAVCTHFTSIPSTGLVQRFTHENIYNLGHLKVRPFGVYGPWAAEASCSTVRLCLVFLKIWLQTEIITDHKQILAGRRLSNMYVYIALVAQCCTASYLCTCYITICKTEEV